MTVKLRRVQPGLYRATVRPIGTSVPAIELEVQGPDPHYPPDYHYRWLVVTDDDRPFPTLKAARNYINRFFEEAA